METWWDTKSRLSIKQKVYLNKSPVDYVSRPISYRLTNKVKKEPQAEEMSKIWRWRCVFETFFCVWWSCCLSCLWRQWYVCKCPPDLNELIIRHSSGYRHCQSLKTPVKEPWSCGEYLGDFQMGKRKPRLSTRSGRLRKKEIQTLSCSRSQWNVGEINVYCVLVSAAVTEVMIRIC